MADKRLLVPLSESVTVRQTVGYAVRTAMSESAELHFVVAVPYDGDVPGGQRDVEGGRRLLERALAWATEDADGSCPPVETAMLGRDELLFGPRDYAQAFAAYAEAHDVDHVILDPEFQPGVTAPMLQPLERELEAVGLVYEEAPVERPARHERLVGRASAGRFISMFGISLGFYLVIGDLFYWFDWVTGIAVGLIVAVTLSQVTFTTAPTFPQSPIRVVRFSLYVPYLVFEIVKANLAISLVILHPRMPIDPKMTRVNARVRSGLPLLALANSITLTPGTLTVRANDQRLVVHTLIASAREDLFDGSLERAIRFVFYGREAAATATPRQRGDTEIIGGEN